MTVALLDHRLGARRVDVGQRDDDPFVALSDPEPLAGVKIVGSSG